MSDSDEWMIRGFLRRAAQAEAPLLGARLLRYAEAEGLSWEELARSLGCGPGALDQVALCRPPREECFARDVEAIAAGYVDPARLLPLLRRLQVLSTLGEAPTPGAAAAAEDTYAQIIAPRQRLAAPLFVAARAYEPEEIEEVEEVVPPARSEAEPASEPREANGDASGAPGEERDA